VHVSLSRIFRYFMIRDNKWVSNQSGVFRTNCIDCLDRTNVVQSMIASKCLQDQFKVRVFLFSLFVLLENVF